MISENKAPYKILLIEDNPGDITLIQDYIEEQFYAPQLTITHSYKDASDVIEQDSALIDVILLDLSLPDRSGEVLINEIVALTKMCCPIIILTGYTDMAFSIKSISMGISDYLIKDELTSAMLYKSILYAIERSDFKHQLEDSEKKFSQMFNLSPQPMMVYDLETLKFQNINEASCKNYGYTVEEFSNLDLLQLYMPEERDRVLRNIKNVDRDKHCCLGNFKQMRKNGEEMEVEIFSTYLVIDERPCCTVIAIDVTEKNMAELKLTQAIIKTQEEERYAIGGELHDNVCQILVGSIMNLSFVLPSLNDERSKILTTGINNIKMAATEIRNLSHRLAPVFFDDVQLKDSLLHLLSSINVSGQFKTHLMYDEKIESIDLNRDLQINLYRILQEQLNNIIKYAKATEINVSFELRANGLLFEIKDNGIGFTPDRANKGIGFANMTRRAKLFSGTFNVDTSPGNGCKITIIFPVERLT